MNEFCALFGLTTSSLRRVCVIIPFMSQDILPKLRIERMKRGSLYSVGDNGLFSVVISRMGALFVGDAVLHLEQAPCEYLILLGSCGAVQKSGLGRGDITLVEKAFCQDSFINMLQKKPCSSVYYPHKDMLEQFCSYQSEYSLKKATCLTVGSLKLEEEYLAAIQPNAIDTEAIDIVDMESAVFYAASHFVGKKALSMLFITDILKQIPYYQALTHEGRTSFKQWAARASQILFALIERGISLYLS